MEYVKQDFGLPVADEAATVADIGAQAFAMTPAEGIAWVEKVGLSNFRVLHTAVTSASNALAICTANVPTPPDAP